MAVEEVAIMAEMKDIEKLRKDIGKLKFEDALSRLEGIVEKLESEEVDLEGSLNLYDEAKLLGEHCSKLLDAAEERVKVVGDSGELNDFE
jgi:exodeoxyribonuclease VII small subunit